MHGSTGPPGVKGEIGETGPKGETGQAGSKGELGDPGPVGEYEQNATYIMSIRAWTSRTSRN